MKKIFLKMAGLLVTSASIAVVAASLKTEKPSENLASEHTPNCQIHHYDAIEPTISTNGVKEYWICCNHNSRGPEFSAPATGNITNAYHYEGFAAEIEPSDDRYIAPYDKLISFEDGKISSFLTIGGANSSIDSNVASDGYNSLKLELTGTMTLDINRKWMKEALALDGIDAIAVDVKASKACGTSSNDNLWYKQGGSWKGHLLGISNIGNEGVNQKWKTVYITKDLVDSLSGTDVPFSIHNSTGKTVWIDNIRPVKKPTSSTLIGAETASIFNDDGKYKVIDIGRTSYDASYKPSYVPIAYVTAESGNNGLNVELSNNYATEGNNSVHITTSVANKVSMFINADMYNATDVGFLFDFYTTADSANTNIKNRYKDEGNNVYYAPQNNTTKGKWITFFVPKSAVYANDYMLFRTDNSGVFDIYIDNIRLADPSLDFENGVVGKVGSRNAFMPDYSGAYFISDNTGTEKMQSDFYSTSTPMSVSTDHSTNGIKSIKMVTVVNDGLYISKRLYDLLPDAGLSLDVYTETDINFNTLQGENPGLHDWNPGEWITITVPKANMKSLNNGYILFTFAAGNITLYIDNVRAAQ